MQAQTIKDLERKIDQLKLLHKLHKLDNHRARFEIKALEIELRIKINNLPRRTHRFSRRLRQRKNKVKGIRRWRTFNLARSI